MLGQTITEASYDDLTDMDRLAALAATLTADGVALMAVDPKSKRPMVDLRSDKMMTEDAAVWSEYQARAEAAGVRYKRGPQPSGLWTASTDPTRCMEMWEPHVDGWHRDRQRVYDLYYRACVRHLDAARAAGVEPQLDPAVIAEADAARQRWTDRLEELESRKSLKRHERVERETLRTVWDYTEQDIEAEARELESLHRRVDSHPMNLALEVGRSHMVVVDCDTEEQVKAFRHWAWTMAGQMERHIRPDAILLGERAADWTDDVMPTVTSPGVLQEDGQWRHKNGGHFYFTIPAATYVDTTTVDGTGGEVASWVDFETAVASRDLPPRTALVPYLGTEHAHTLAAGRNDYTRVVDPYAAGAPRFTTVYPIRYADGVATITVEWGSESFDVFVYSHYVLIPPSRRPEGDYAVTGEVREVPLWLYEYIAAEADAKAQETNRREQRQAALGDDADMRDAVVDWYATVSWAEILGPLGWTATGSHSECGCPEWHRPGGASMKSATAHEPGCSHYRHSDDPPMMVWTSAADGPVGDAVARFGHGGTVTKFDVYACAYYEGDRRRAYREGVRPDLKPYDIRLTTLAPGVCMVDITDNAEEAA